MSMRRIAVLAAVNSNQGNASNSGNSPPGNYHPSGYNMSGNSSGKMGRFETDMNGNVNVLLGGAMLSGVIIVVILVCYCCHKNSRKNRPQGYSPYWREPDVHSLEVFTMDSHAIGRFLAAQPCYDPSASGEEITAASAPCSGAPGPPPAYESLIFKPSSSEKKEETQSGSVESVAPLGNREDSHGRSEKREDDEGLPSYEAALKLEANGYV